MARAFLILLIIFPLTTLADLEISKAWIKNLPSTIPVRAGYMTIFNPGNNAIRIMSVASNVFKIIEVHQTFIKDGLMRMEQVSDLTIEPSSRLSLEPGGMHLMMMSPIEPVKLGDNIRVTFELDDGSQQSQIFTVKK